MNEQGQIGMDARNFVAGIISNTKNAVNIVSEPYYVNQFRSTSDVYKKLKSLSSQPDISTDPTVKKIMGMLNSANSFTEMYRVVSEEVSITQTPPPVKWGVKAITFFAGYISPLANFTYYLMFLRQDIRDYATSQGYSFEEPNEFRMGR